MAVLVEAISVIIRADALLKAFAGSFDDFKSIVPNVTLCADGEVVRVGFMAPEDAEEFVRELGTQGLQFVIGGEAIDLAVVDQQHGPTINTPWLEFGHIGWEGNAQKRVACCRLKGSTSNQMVAPDGWSYEGSLTETFLFVTEDSINTLEPINDENGAEEFRTPLHSKTVFIGRTKQRD